MDTREARSRYGRVFLILLILPGLAVILHSLYQAGRGVGYDPDNFTWILILIFTSLGAAFPVSFPSPSRHQGLLITFGDLFLYTALLLYGPAIATLVAVVEGVIGNLRSWSRIQSLEKALFNVCQLSLATWVAAQAFYLLSATSPPFDSDIAKADPSQFLFYLGSITVLHYILNTGSVAIAMALYSGEPLFHIIRRGFIWTSLSTAMGAVVGALVVLKMQDSTILVVLLVMLIAFITYNVIRFYQQHIEKLVRSRQFLQSIVDSISAYVAILDKQGQIIAVNKEWASFAKETKLVGPCGQEGENFRKVLLEVGQGTANKERSQKINEAIQRVIEYEVDEHQSEFSCGEGLDKHWFALQIHRFRDDGELRIVIEFGDITTRKTLEEQLRHAQKMEAIGRLAGGVAHDFNNILTIISGYGAFLMDAVDGDPKVRHHVETILDAADRASAVTRQLLAFSRKQVMEPQVLPLNDLVKETEKLIRRLIGEDIELITTLSPDTGPVRVDPAQFSQVLMNLVVNARDAMPDGGTLRLETWAAQLSRGSLPNAEEDFVEGRYSCLRVKDTGEGIDNETLKHIFEPFFSTKESGKGTGLGLSTVYGIIKQSAGHIEVISQRGKGTSFEVYLPQMQESQDHALGQGEAQPLSELHQSSLDSLNDEFRDQP